MSSNLSPSSSPASSSAPASAQSAWVVAVAMVLEVDIHGTQSQFDKLWTMTDPLLPNATKNGFRKPKSAHVSMAYAHASPFTKSSGQSWRPRQLQYKLTVELKVLTTMLQSTSSYFPCLTLNT